MADDRAHAERPIQQLFRLITSYQVLLTMQTILITGASAGIGASCAKAFARRGDRLILCARRVERVREMEGQLRELGAPDILVVELDVSRHDQVVTAIASLPDRWNNVDVLVNNAGLSRGLDPIYEGKYEDWEEMIDTNVKGLLYVSRAILPAMVARGEGHVINIGSIAGHQVYPKGNVYCATKHAVGAITQGMQIDLHGTGVRVTTVDPGLVETEFSMVRFRGNMERASATYRGTRPLSPDDVAEAVVWCASRPAHVSVHELILMPADQASATMVKRST